jgi:DNA-binding SARP family transcriptional activator/Tfp pilus assembly protein PilF
MRISLLGPFDCRDAEGNRIVLPTRKAEAIVALLAVSCGEARTREKIAGLLWAETTEARARANLRKTVSRLKGALPRTADGCLAVGAAGLSLDPDRVEVDVRRFEELARAGTPDALQEASALYRGQFLEGLHFCSEALDDWLTVVRQNLEEGARNVFECLLNHYVVTGAIERGIEAALRLLAMDPLQEGVHRTLIRLYMHQERLGAAYRQYEACREVLARELDVAPGPETERLKAELLRRLPPSRGEAVSNARAGADLPPGDAEPSRSERELRVRPDARLSSSPSIAVLPFSVPRTEEDLAYLGDGIAEDIATDLGRFSELDVIAPVAILSYRAAETKPSRVGAELGVRYLLQGSLRPSRTGLRITARLVDSESGRQIWAMRQDCARADFLGVEDELVRRIVGALVGRIEQRAFEESRRKRPADWQAYDYSLRGWHSLRQVDAAAIREARRYFEKALEKDPAFARAYVGLACASLSEWYCYSWNHWVFAREEALAYARKALEFDHDDPKALCMLGMAELYGNKYESARSRLIKALDLNPNDTDVLAHTAFAMALIGEHESAVEAGRNALRLAPHHPEWYAAFAGIAFFAAQLYEEAVETMLEAPQALCDTPAFIAASYAYLGRVRKARPYRDTVHNYFERKVAENGIDASTSCVDWILSINPFGRASDASHLRHGLAMAGFK